MKTILALLACLIIALPAWADDTIFSYEQNGKIIVVAMKHLDIGMKEGFRANNQAGGAPVVTYYVLDESSNTLTDESGNKLIQE